MRIFKKGLRVAPILSIALLASPVHAGEAPEAAVQEQREASIPFVDSGGIRDWHAEGRDTLYIQDRHRNWYKATLMMPSHELPFAWAIGFETGPIDRLDRFSNVVVEGRSYPLASLVEVEGPPQRKG
jgi:hypothetical protein